VRVEFAYGDVELLAANLGRAELFEANWACAEEAGYDAVARKTKLADACLTKWGDWPMRKAGERGEGILQGRDKFGIKRRIDSWHYAKGTASNR
jgi:hypothetical protein